MDASYVLGLDLGPPGEPTGFAALEWPAADDPTPASEYHLRHLERFRPGTGYPAVLAAVAARAGKPPLRGAPLVAVVTAVGRGVVDLLYAAGLRVVPIVVGAGHAVQWVERVGQAVPKKELVTALQLALQARRLKVAPGLPDADVLAGELAAFRLRRVSVGEADAAEWRVGRHDDLVFAVALACWHADRHPPRRPAAERPAPPDPLAGLFGRSRAGTSGVFPRWGTRR